MNTEKKANEIIDSYLYALVKKKGYTKDDLLDALTYIASGKVEYRNSGHPLEQLGTDKIQTELFKSIIKKSAVERHSGNTLPQHSLEFIVMDAIEKEGAKKAFLHFIEEEDNINRLSEKYISDHFEFDEDDLFYSKLHEDMEQFMILKSCEEIVRELEAEELLEDVLDTLLEEELELEQEKEEIEVEMDDPKNILDDLFEEEPIEETLSVEIEEAVSEEKETEQEEKDLLPSTDMEKLEYALAYMQKKIGYKDSTLIDVLNSAIDGNYKVFTRENGIRELVESLPKDVLANKKALLLMKQMEEAEAQKEDMLDF